MVTLSITAASALYPAFSGTNGVVLVNSGQNPSTVTGDASTLRASAIFTQGANMCITNLSGATITAARSKANAVRADSTSTGTVLANHGTITPINCAPVDFGSVTLGATASLINAGLLLGAGLAFRGVGFLAHFQF